MDARILRGPRRPSPRHDRRGGAHRRRAAGADRQGPRWSNLHRTCERRNWTRCFPSSSKTSSPRSTITGPAERRADCCRGRSSVISGRRYCSVVGVRDFMSSTTTSITARVHQQLCGPKRLYFFAPDQTEHLYPRQSAPNLSSVNIHARPRPLPTLRRSGDADSDASTG